MNPSPACVALVKEFEGCRLEAYRDSVGIPTIGYGHIQGVKMGDTCTQEQADAWLVEEINSHAQGVSALLKLPVTQHQFDALVSFAFNLGTGALSKSTLLRLLNAGDFHGAAEEFPKWCMAGGKRVDGLLRRRIAEQELFLS